MRHSSIGRGFDGAARRAALGVSVAAIALDFWVVWLVWRAQSPVGVEGRWAIAIVALAAQLWLARGDLPTFGLAAPEGGWRRWTRIAAGLGVAIAALLAVAAAVWSATGRPLPMPKVAPHEIASAFFRMCVFAPVLEETLYRAVLCSGVTAALGARWAIAASGAAFGLLHVVYGNPSPENLVGGFLLAWAYLRSGSIYVPLALHAGGNLFILIAQIAAWRWFATPA